jgi:hypothetical protein
LTVQLLEVSSWLGRLTDVSTIDKIVQIIGTIPPGG